MNNVPPSEYDRAAPDAIKRGDNTSAAARAPARKTGKGLQTCQKGVSTKFNTDNHRKATYQWQTNASKKIDEVRPALEGSNSI